MAVENPISKFSHVIFFFFYINFINVPYFPLGVAVMAVHCAEIRRVFHQVPIPLPLGPPNTGKSLLARVAAALIGGLHEEGTRIFHNLSMACMVDLLVTVNFFVYNDPGKTDVLKTLITKVSVRPFCITLGLLLVKASVEHFTQAIFAVSCRIYGWGWTHHRIIRPDVYCHFQHSPFCSSIRLSVGRACPHDDS